MSQVFTKYSEEYFVISMDFSPNMITGEVIDPVQSLIVAHDPEGNDVSATVLDSSSKAVVDDIFLTIKVQAGTVETDYSITFKAYISADKFLIEKVVMKVR